MCARTTSEQKRQHADYTREWRKRVKADKERYAHVLELKRESQKRYRAKHEANVSDGESGGRRKKPVVFAEIMKTVRCSHGRHCRDCPKWHPSYCSITCATRLANSPMCKYGAKLLNNEECKRRYKERNSRLTSTRQM